MIPHPTFPAPLHRRDKLPPQSRRASERAAIERYPEDEFAGWDTGAQVRGYGAGGGEGRCEGDVRRGMEVRGVR